MIPPGSQFKIIAIIPSSITMIQLMQLPGTEPSLGME